MILPPPLFPQKTQQLTPGNSDFHTPAIKPPSKSVLFFKRSPGGALSESRITNNILYILNQGKKNSNLFDIWTDPSKKPSPIIKTLY
jgi:hypothetical protein